MSGVVIHYDIITIIRPYMRTLNMFIVIENVCYEKNVKCKTED